MSRCGDPLNGYDIFPLFFPRDAEKGRWISQWYENIRITSSWVASLVPLLCKADEYTIAHDLALHALNSIRQAEQDIWRPSEESKILLLVPALVAVEEMNQARGVLASISSQLRITDGLEHVKAMCALAITLYNTDDLGSMSIAWEKAQSADAQAVFLRPKDDATARVSLATTGLLLGIDPDDAIDVVAQIVDVDSEDYFSIDEYRIRADGLGVLILRLAHRNKLQEEQSSRQSRILRLVSRSSRSQETKHIQKAVNALLDPAVLEKWHEKVKEQSYGQIWPLHWLADPSAVDLFQYIGEDRRLNAILEERTIDTLDSYAGTDPFYVHREYREFAYIMARAFLILGNSEWATKPIIHVCNHRHNIDYITVLAEMDIRQSQDPAFARSLLDVFQRALGIVGNRNALAQALPSLVAACLYVGDPDLVRETMMRLSNNDTYAIYANAMAHVIPAAMHIDPDLVNQLFQHALSMEHSGWPLRGFTPIWTMPECRVHYHKALDRAFNTQDEWYGALLFEILAPTLAANARAADLQRAVKTCKQYTDAQAKLKGLSGLAPALYQLGLDNKAEEAIAKAEEIAYRELEGVDIENDTIGETRGLLKQVLNPLAVARAAMDQFDSALEHLRHIDIILKPMYYHQSYGRDVDRENFYEPLATLATILAKKSAYSEIQSILSEIHTDITARSQPIHQACDQVLESLCNIAIARQDTRLWHMICSLSGTAQRCTQKELRFITLAVLEMRDSKRLLDLLPFLKTDEELENVDDMKRSVVIHQHIAGLIETKEHREALRFIAAISDPDVRSQALEQFADSIDADERIVESEIADMLLVQPPGNHSAYHITSGRPRYVH
jgi:hypothetical protein